MAELNFTSLQDTIVPPVYIEEVVIRYPSREELEVNNPAGISFIDQYGNQKFSTTQIVDNEQQIENVVSIDIKAFLMLSQKTYDNIREGSGTDVQVYVIIADNNRKINLLRSGEYTFDELQELLAEKRLIHKIIPIKDFLDNVKPIEDNGTVYYKLTTDASIQSPESKNIAVFSFATIPTRGSENNRVSLSSENLLYGKFTGEFVLRDGIVPQEYYYFLNSENQIWAGGVHRERILNTNESVYKEGLKKTRTLQRTLDLQQVQTYKVFDRRQTDIDAIFDSLIANFNFIEETTVAQDEQTSEKLSFKPPTSGISPLISSIIKKQELTLKNKAVKNTSNLLFIDAEEVLRENSVYSSFIDRLDNNELEYVRKATYVDIFEVARVSLANREERQETIISTSFRPGDDTAKAQTRNISDAPITSENKFTTYTYFEEETTNTFGSPFEDYKVLSFVDEVPALFRKSDFYYRVDISMNDGLRTFILSKVDALKQALLSFKALYSKLNNPTLFDETGDFVVKAKNIQDDNSIVDVLSLMVSSLEFFFDLTDIVLPVDLLRALYFSVNTKTGNIYEMRKAYDAYEKLYTFVADQFGIPEVGSGVGSIDKQTSGKEIKSIQLEVVSEILNLNFDDHVGLKYADTYNPVYKIDGVEQKIPVFAPAVSRKTLNSDSRIDPSLSTPTKDDTYLTYYKPHSVFLDRDYLLAKNMINNIESNEDYLEYLGIVLNDSIRQSVQDKYSGRFGYAATKQNNKKKRLLGQKDIKYYRYVSILESLSDNGISIDFDFDQASIVNNIDRNRREVENPEERGKLVNLDHISSKLPTSLSKVVQSAYANKDATSLIVDAPGKNPLQFTLFRFKNPIGVNFNPDITLPFQYDSFGTPVTDFVLYDDNENLRLFDTNHLAYYYYNYSLIGVVKVLTGFEDRSMRPIYKEMTTDTLAAQNLGKNTKYLCKVEQYSNSEFLTNLYDQVKNKILEENFVTIQGAPKDGQIPLQDLIAQTKITAPVLPTTSITISQAAEQIKLLNLNGFNLFEKYFSSSLYIRQPKEVRELRFEFDRPEADNTNG